MGRLYFSCALNESNSIFINKKHYIWRMAIKITIYQELQKLIDKRVQNATKAMQAAELSKNNQTKSSAGDKFETGRAMMQAEEDRSKLQLLNALALQRELAQVPYQFPFDTVSLGSLVYTTQGNYFISIGLGKVVFEGITYFAISLAAPIGELLLGKKVGEAISFRDKKITIQQIK